MAGSHGDALLIENRADVVGVDTVDHKRQNRKLFGRGSDEPDADT